MVTCTMNEEKKSTKQLISEYIELLKKNANRFSEPTQQLIENIIKSTNIDSYYFNINLSMITDHLGDCSIFDLSKSSEILEALTGKHFLGFFEYINNNFSKYGYQSGYNRQPYKSKDISLYQSKFKSLLQSIIHYIVHNDNLYLIEDDSSSFNYLTLVNNIPTVAAYLLDQNDKAMEQLLIDAITSDNNTTVLTRDMIFAILKSSNQKLVKLLGDLLLAAKLQEGLRQSILESVDDGTVENFIYFIKLVIDNNLMRFSSVFRSFLVWTKLGDIPVEKPVLSVKSLSTLYECLVDPCKRQECEQSENKIEIYLSLWAQAVYDIDNIQANLERIFSKNQKYKSLVAIFFITSLHDQSLMIRYCLPIIESSDDLEMHVWIDRYLYIPVPSSYGLVRSEKDKFKYTGLLTKEQAKMIFNRYNELLPSINKSVTFYNSCFDGYNLTLTIDDLLGKMLFAAAYLDDDSMIDTLIDLMPKMKLSLRESLVKKCLYRINTAKQRTALIHSLKNSNIGSIYYINKLDIKFTNDEYLYIEDLLRLKTNDVRLNAMKYLSKQNSADFKASINRLLSSKSLNKRLAALDMIMEEVQNSDNHNEIESDVLELVKNLKATSPSEKSAIQLINGENALLSKWKLKNGFGLLEKSNITSWPEPEQIQSIDIKDTFMLASVQEFETALTSFFEFFESHKNDEITIENYYGTKNTVTLGTIYTLHNHKCNDAENPIDRLHFSDIIKQYVEENPISQNMLITYYFISNNYPFRHDYINSKISTDEKNKSFKKIYDQYFPVEQMQQIYSIINDGNSQKHQHFKTILSVLYQPNYNMLSKFAVNTLSFLYWQLEDEMFKIQAENNYNDFKFFVDTVNTNNSIIWLFSLLNYLDDKDLTKAISLSLAYDSKADKASRSHVQTNPIIYAKAYELGLANKDDLINLILFNPVGKQLISDSTSTKHDNKFSVTYPKSDELIKQLVYRLVEIESLRTDSNTDATSYIDSIGKFEGTFHLINVLSRIDENDSFTRGYACSSANKKESLSNLIARCHPAQGENINTFNQMIKGKKIPVKILVNTAMYAVQWTDIICDHIGWKGMKSTCWYFRAHTGEYNSNKDNEKIISKYSPIELSDFYAGAFDIDWFKESYKEIGKKRFEILYDSAKYISTGSTHRRSQLFADAVLKKLKLKETETRIFEKRNKNYMLCYGLIPLRKDRNKDILKRYTNIQKFLKQSKSFGAQRRASEAEICEIALTNLARNAGYSDTSRLTLFAESLLTKSLSSYLEPKAIEDYSVFIEISAPGNFALVAFKDDKKLKSIPAKLKKHKYVLESKEVLKQMREQFSRAKATFERALEIESSFNADEIQVVMSNIIISPIISKLVFKCGENLGFFKDMQLISPNGEITALENSSELFIAHPIHLYKSGKWSEYQKHIMQNKISQPFKQVFRELYLANEDELEKHGSLRYAGHQLQPGKLHALMKARGWLNSGEKIFYDKDIIAHLYGLPEYYSPADVEAPKLESVAFYSRKDNKYLLIKDIPAILFSEIMRDVDLFVAVAHIGGVDPEASLSTIDMRKSIVQEMLSLLRISNVTFKERHAIINGTFGEYTIHLGSGMVQKAFKGSINIISVASGHRGRIFLPFMDEDPRTVEIVSKILMLSEDHKIKDPSIMEQIVPTR